VTPSSWFGHETGQQEAGNMKEKANQEADIIKGNAELKSESR
jgi:hypothetical protein